MTESYEPIAEELRADPRVLYVLVFGSDARGSSRTDSDLDLALGTSHRFSAMDVGDLISRLETLVGRSVDLIMMDEASPGIAYRVFRDGIVIVERDRSALVRRKARAIDEYFDFKPIEDIFIKGALAAANGR